MPKILNLTYNIIFKMHNVKRVDLFILIIKKYKMLRINI